MEPRIETARLHSELWWTGDFIWLLESDWSVVIIKIGVDSLPLASFFMRHTSQLHMSGKEIFTARALAVCIIPQLCLEWEVRKNSKCRYFSGQDYRRCQVLDRRDHHMLTLSDLLDYCSAGIFVQCKLGLGTWHKRCTTWGHPHRHWHACSWFAWHGWHPNVDTFKIF